MKPQTIPLDVLSFVDMPRRRKTEGPPRFWVVTPTDDYVDATQKGHEYAIELAQYFKLNRQWVGANTLINIVGGMDLEDHTPTKGYMVGFFAYLEGLIARAAVGLDLCAELQRTRAATLDLQERMSDLPEEDEE